MKKITVLLIAILLASTNFLPACRSRRSEPIIGRPHVITNSKVKHGQEVYMKNCQPCHPGGEAGLGPSINANPAPGFIKRFQVRHGLGVMPAFKQDTLSQKDVAAVSKYMKALKRF